MTQVHIQKRSGYGGRGQLCMAFKVTGCLLRHQAISLAREKAEDCSTRRAYSPLSLHGYPVVDGQILIDLVLNSARPIFQKGDEKLGDGFNSAWEVVFCWQQGGCSPEEERVRVVSGTESAEIINSLASVKVDAPGTGGTIEPLDIAEPGDVAPFNTAGVFRNCDGEPTPINTIIPKTDLKINLCVPNEFLEALRAVDPFSESRNVIVDSILVGALGVDAVAGKTRAIVWCELLNSMIGSTNQTSFLGFAPGTLLLTDIQENPNSVTTEFVLCFRKDTPVEEKKLPAFDSSSGQVDPTGLCLSSPPHHVVQLICHQLPGEELQDPEEISYECATIHAIYPKFNFGILLTIIKSAQTQFFGLQTSCSAPEKPTVQGLENG